MKKYLLFVGSLALGFMVTSCQNDLEEVMEFNDDVATTRSIDETSNEVNEEAPDDINNLLNRSSVPTLSGASIIRGRGR